ncbi:MAG: hypothetical protein J6J42_04010 [Lachnospiraceae bacterium]|nr:hypothetical protein [Lachnospiraceae bacterium]
MKQKEFRKKGKEEWFHVPEEFRKLTGMYGITLDGIGIYSGGRFDKAYYCNANKEQVSNFERVKGCTMLLRGSGVRFCFYELPEQEQKVLLLVSVRAGLLETAQNAFLGLEKDIQGNLYTFGITIYPLKAEDKLYLMHHLIMQDAVRARIDVRKYMEKTSGWLPDFKLDHYEEKKEVLVSKERASSVMYVRKIPAEHVARACRKIREEKSCRMLVTAFEPVTDQQVKECLQSNYIGLEASLQAIIRRKRGVGRISDEKDERRYVYAGIYFVISAGTEAELEQDKRQLEQELKQFGGKIEPYQYYQKQTWQKLSCLNPWEVCQTRLLQSGSIAAMNPFYQEDRVPESDEIGVKAELLAVFDAMAEKQGGAGWH